MIVDTPFLIADPSRWGKGWLSGKEYDDLAKYSCDKLSIRRLAFRVKEQSGARIELGTKVTLTSRAGNDKEVHVSFKVIRGEDVVTNFAIGPFKLEESDTATKTIYVTLPAAALNTDPKPVLRITLSAWNT